MRRPLRRTVLVPLVALTLLAGCSSTDGPTAGTASSTAASETATTDSSTETVSVSSAAEAVSSNAPDHDEDADYVWDAADEVVVTLTGTSATSATSDSSAVSVDGSTVTITAGGTYRLTGSLTDGQVVVDSADDAIVRVILDGVDLASSTTSPFVVTDAEKAMIVLADGSANTISDATSYVYPDAETDEPNGAIFSKENLTITGSGSLDVTGNADDAIVSKDGLVITGGTITVTAADDGIRGKDYLVVRDRDGNSPTITVTSASDGLKSTNDTDATMGYVLVEGGTVDITSGDDSIQGETDVVVTGGTITAASAGGHDATVAEDASGKGIKGLVSVVVTDGEITVDSGDDAVHSNGLVDISGGDLTIAAGDDAVHADAILNVSGGTIDVTSSYEGLEAAQITLSGGQIDVVSSDDGINVSGGADSSGMGGPGGGAPGGQGGGMGGGADTFTADADYFLLISGGQITVDAGGDGLDANGSIQITGGTTVVNGPTDGGNGALDADGGIEVSGGVLVAAGSEGMAETPSTASPQAFASVVFSSAQAAATTVHLLDADGAAVVSFTPTKAFQTIVFSTPEIISGTTYTIAVGGEVTGETVAGLTLGGVVSGTKDAGSVTA